MAQRDGVVPVEVALGVLGAGAGAVSHQAVAGVAAEAHGAAGMQTRLAEEQPVGWRLREAAVRGWGEGQTAQIRRWMGPHQTKPLGITPCSPHPEAGQETENS